MKESYTSKRRVRRSFGKIDSVSEMPSLIEVQTGSYNSFINGQNSEFGLDEVFKSIFPIKDFSGNGELEFVKYELEEPKYDVEECLKRDMTYAAPVKATLRLVVWDIDEDTGAKSIHDIKEQDVYMGDIPLMTEKGTFIFNGTERVVVSQMHRSPGVFFDHDKGKTVSSGKYLFAARVIPYRGSWLDFEFDAKDLVYARIDRRRKLPVTSILYSLYSKETEEKIAQLAKEGKKINPAEVKGMDKEEILSYFYDVDTYEAVKKDWKVKFEPARMKGVKFDFDLVDAETGKTVWEAGKKLNARMAQKLADEGLSYYKLAKDRVIGKFLANNVITKAGEVLAEAGDELTEELLDKFEAEKIKENGLENLIFRIVVLVVPRSNLTELKQLVYFHGGFTFFVVSEESLEPLIASFKEIEKYAVAEQYDPADREKIINLIALFDTHIRKQNAVNLLAAAQGLTVLSEKNRLPGFCKKKRKPCV